ncbi:MAG: hypothetical protein M3Y68_08495 [Chloroflexota bacterium]|nr:hypothetical protein [Chloroflexota bacterium]
MILTLLITLLVESPIAVGYALWRRKPLRLILFTSICGNLLTQSLLWLLLNFFFDQYFVVLILAEILIWILEGLLLHVVAFDQLPITEAMLLSFLMNTASIALGWFLPV